MMIRSRTKLRKLLILGVLWKYAMLTSFEIGKLTGLGNSVYIYLRLLEDEGMIESNMNVDNSIISYGPALHRFYRLKNRSVTRERSL